MAFELNFTFKKKETWSVFHLFHFLKTLLIAVHKFPTKETTYTVGVIISIFQIKKLSCKGLHRLHLKYEYATLLKLCTVMKTYFLKLQWKIAFLRLKTNVLKCCSASITKYSICHIAIPPKWSLSLSLIIFKKITDKS